MVTQKIKLFFNKKDASRKLSKPVFQTAKLLIFLLLAYYLYNTVQLKLLDNSLFAALQLTFAEYHLWLLLPIGLLFVNWSLEAMKWQFVASKIERISFYTAIKGTLTGVALGVVTPIGIGEYIGRILQLDNDSRFKAIGAVLVSNISQLYVTLIWGSLALWVVYPDPFEIDSWWLAVIWWSMPVFHLLFILVFVIKASMLTKLKENYWFGLIYEWVEVISNYTYEDLLYLFCLSLFRYFIFTIQFVMILYLFGVSKDITLLLLGVNFIFLLKTIIPTLFDFGVRESAAIFFFGIYGCSEELVLLASLSLWFINIIVPAFIGLFFILKLKVFPKQ